MDFTEVAGGVLTDITPCERRGLSELTELLELVSSTQKRFKTEEIQRETLQASREDMYSVP